MPGGKHSEQLATSPTQDQLDLDLEGPADLPQGRERQPTDLATLDQRTGRDRNARDTGQVGLPPTQSEPDPPERPAQCEILHGEILALRAHRWLIAFA